jgi:methylphosphotriester-DNA--protein-cysteine methyltransferase
LQLSKALDDALSLRIVQPSEQLRPFVTAYYLSEIDSPTPIDDLSVPEWGNIRLIYQGGFQTRSGVHTGRYTDNPVIQGPASRGVRFTIQSCRMLGIGLLPAGFARFWDLHLGRLADQSEPLAEVAGNAASNLAKAVANAVTADEKFELVDAWLTVMLHDSADKDVIDMVGRVQALLNNPDIAHVEQLADTLQLTPSALARFCKRRFGFPPKLLLRRQRFLRMLDALHGRPYADWPDFLDPQYTDQSHMIRDFKYFMGMSPTQYLALPRMAQKASARHRSQALGSALQGLA